MNIDEYMTSRVDVEIAWYSKKSQYCQKWYKRLQITEIVLAAFIPLLSSYTENNTVIAFIVGAFGAVIAIIESITKLNKYHENWIQYRTTCELLKYQKYLYLTSSAPYNDADETKENLFVKNIESIISSENNKWKIVNSQKDQQSSTSS